MPVSRKTIRRKTMRKRVKRAPKLRVSKAIKAYVKKATRSASELKHAVPYVVNNANIQAYGISPNGPNQCTTFDLSQVLAIPQGTDDGQRVGDKIRVKSMSLQGYINLDSSLANDGTYLKNPMYIKMYVGRRIDTINDPNTYSYGGGTGFNNLFANGPTASAPQNLPSDMYRYINKDVYRIYATRMFKIGMSAPSNDPSGSNQWNNDFKFSKHFTVSLNKHIEHVKYFDGSTIPSNVGIYCWFTACWANGVSVTSVSRLPLECHFDVNCTYYDS